MRHAIILLLGCAFIWACEDEKPAAPVEVAPVVAPAAVKTAPTPTPAASAAAAATEEQKAVEENPLTPCCRALGKIGFVEHSPEYTAAAKECGEGMTAKKSLGEISAGLKKTLKGKVLPDECTAK